jgi:hypothetical protein
MGKCNPLALRPARSPVPRTRRESGTLQADYELTRRRQIEGELAAIEPHAA